MSTTHADVFGSSWYRQKYFLKNGFLQPVILGNDVILDEYNPFDFYKEGNRQKDNLHHLFADVDTENETKILEFYNKFGPLGLFSNKVLKIVSHNPSKTNHFNFPDKSPVVGVLRDSSEVMTIDGMIKDFHIPREKLLPEQKIPSIFQGPEPLLLNFYAREPVKEFKRQCNDFKWILNIKEAAVNKDTQELKRLFNKQGSAVYKEIATSNDSDYLLANALHVVISRINIELTNRVTPFLDFNKTHLAISKSITWHCDSLLTCLYVMMFIDITRGVHIRRCQNKKCGDWFEASKPEVKFCSPTCQSATNTRKHRKMKEVLGLFSEGKSVNEIEALTGETREQIEEWIERSKEV